MTDLIKIETVEPLEGHRLRLWFSDDAVKEVDLTEVLKRGGVFADIRDRRELFEDVAVNPETGTIEWPGGIDLDAEVLYGRYEPASGTRIPRRTVEEPRAEMMRILDRLRRGPETDGLSLERVGEALDLPPTRVRELLDTLDRWGLVAGSPEEDLPFVLLRAGRQFLERKGRVDRDVLQFLPHVIDDLNARQALLIGGSILVDEFRQALLSGTAVEHAQDLVPSAFAPAVTSRIAIDLFAASVALMARLSYEEPAGCVAEEIIAVTLLHEAETVLELYREESRVSDDAAKAATAALRGIFELFQDDDVLATFEMEEPADAALAGETSINTQLGVVDQRVEAWFEAFGWTVPTGYLASPRRTSRGAQSYAPSTDRRRTAIHADERRTA